MAEVSLVKLPSHERHWTLLKIGQHQFKQKQAITWTNVDQYPCRHLASRGLGDLSK